MGKNVDIDTRHWELAVAKAERAAELYLLHVQLHGRPQPELKKTQRPLPRQKQRQKHRRAPVGPSWSRPGVCFDSFSRPWRLVETEETIRLQQKHEPKRFKPVKYASEFRKAC